MPAQVQSTHWTRSSGLSLPGTRRPLRRPCRATSQPLPASDAGGCQAGQQAQLLLRRSALMHVLSAVPLAVLFAAAVPLAPPPASALAIKAADCPGLGGYNLRKCLRKAREAREAAAPPETEGERFKYNNPGTLVTLPSGIEYREIETGTGPVVATLGSEVELTYIVYRLSSGGYFKYSSGGTPVFLWSLGYGKEGKDDLCVTYRCVLGAPGSLPAAVTPALVGMRAGGKRRVFVPPQLGWVNDQVGPKPDTFGGQRRLISRREEPLLFEAEMVRVNAPAPGAVPVPAQEVPGLPFRLPLPLSPNSNMLPPS